jgi:hypothetical protein
MDEIAKEYDVVVLGTGMSFSPLFTLLCSIPPCSRPRPLDQGRAKSYHPYRSGLILT